MSDFAEFVSPQASTHSDAQLLSEAGACLDRFTAAFNRCDTLGMDAELHFPHLMLSGARQLVWEQPGQHPDGFFDGLKAAGWASTQYERKEPVLVSADKVHFVVVYTRRDKNSKILSTHTNLWIATCIDGEWGIAVRSY